MNNCNEIIRSPIFYMGNKYKLLNQLLPLFPNNIDTFYDLFGGSGCVSANVSSNKTIYNELNGNIVKLFELFINYDSNYIDNAINNYIKLYDLNKEGTDVRQNNPDIKETRDFYNKKYIKFRESYNKSERDYLMLYTLTFYSFSNLIRFNKNNEFNMPYGNRCYTSQHKQIIDKWCNKIKTKNILINQKNAFDILENTNFNQEDFIYLDPPYFNTLAIYNEKRAFGGWDINCDFRLFKILEKLNLKGIKWGLSNVFKNKNNINNHLIKWCEKNKWNVYHLDFTYSSLGKGNAKSDEVYICNYNLENYNQAKQISIFDFIGDEK